MREYNTMIKKAHKNYERGQAIIIIAAAFVGMVAMVGLMTDGGMLLVEYARLKRSIDAASIASAAQFRKNIDTSDIVLSELETAAREFLILNQSDADEITIDTCTKLESYPTDPLCKPPVRKLVEVKATRHVNFGFLRVLGINGTDITASSVGEAASIDMVLVIDTSASMAFETTGKVLDPNYDANCLVINEVTHSPYDCVHPNKTDRDSLMHPDGDNPIICNATSEIGKRCEPLGTIKDVALKFVGKSFFPYDRVSIVALTQQTANGTRRTFEVLPLTGDQAAVEAAIRGLKVFQPSVCPDPANEGAVCLNFKDYKDIDTDGDGNLDETADVPDQGAVYLGAEFKDYRDTLEINSNDSNPDNNFGDPSLITSSNIGGGLYMAGYEFTKEPMRQDSFWVVIALIGGPANATNRTGEFPPENVVFDAKGFCPQETWVVIDQPDPLPNLSNFCRDADSTSRHWIGPAPLYSVPNEYDADDFARDAADFVADPVVGQGATIFSICVGNYCTNYPSTDPASAQNLGIYMAEKAGDGDVDGDSDTYKANHGSYYLAIDASGLDPIFKSISDKIFTRISQ